MARGALDCRPGFVPAARQCILQTHIYHHRPDAKVDANRHYVLGHKLFLTIPLDQAALTSVALAHRDDLDANVLFPLEPALVHCRENASARGHVIATRSAAYHYFGHTFPPQPLDSASWPKIEAYARHPGMAAGVGAKRGNRNW